MIFFVGYAMCQTIHKINTLTGLTLFVNKRCALPSECSMEMVGCHNTNRPGIQVVYYIRAKHTSFSLCVCVFVCLSVCLSVCLPN